MINKELFVKAINQIKRNQEKANKFVDNIQNLFENGEQLICNLYEESDDMIIKLLANSFEEDVDIIDNILISWIYENNFGQHDNLNINRPVIKDGQLVEWKGSSTVEELYDYIVDKEYK